jgi:hypothetical protein
MLVTETGTRTHPAVIEVGQRRVTFARLLAALRLPAGDEVDPQPNRLIG